MRLEKKLKLAGSILLALTGAPLFADCLDTTITQNDGENPVLEFDAYPGASNYLIEAYDRSLDAWVNIATTGSTGLVLPDLDFGSDQELQIRIIPRSVQGTLKPCLGRATFQVASDPETRHELGRLILPAAGSLPGAFDSQWRTILALSNNSDQTMNGRIVFHPAGQIASDSDPSINYSLRPGEVAQWDDIVLAVGGSGMGSLDIIPTEVTASSGFGPIPVPEVQARIVNDAPEGTYGTDVPEIFVGDFAPSLLRPYAFGEIPIGEDKARGIGTTIAIPSDYENLRINVGARYLDLVDRFATAPGDPGETPFIQLALRRNGEYIETAFREADPGYVEQFALDTIFETELQPGDAVVIRSISALVYWTLNDNRTNDPMFVFDTYTGVGPRLLIH